MESVLLILLTVGGITGIGVLGIFGLTLVGRVKSAPTNSGVSSRKLDEIEERLTEMEADVAELSRADQQILALDERVEFLERLLQQVRDRGWLPPSE